MRQALLATALLSAATIIRAPIASSHTSSAHRAPLTVSRTRLTPLGVKHFYVRGWYPQFSSSTVSTARVNATVRGRVQHIESSFRTFAAKFDHHTRGERLKTMRFLDFLGSQEQLTANTSLESMLIPYLECGSTFNSAFCTRYLAITAVVPSGRSVRLRQLFMSPESEQALRVISEVIRRNLIATNACVRAALTNRQIRSIYAPSVGPDWSNFGHFYLARNGLTVGFVGSRVAPFGCVRFVTATAPYRKIARILSPLGRYLVRSAES